MKKIIIYSLLLLSVFSSCKKDYDEPESGQRPDERLTEMLDNYKKTLTGNEYGWKGYLYTNGGEGYSFLFKFSANDRVKMVADLNSQTATTFSESTYRLKAIQAPSLLFDTYSYIHIIADPDGSQNGGVDGWGRYSDFEFSFQSASTDTIKLIGNHLKSELVLVRASKEEYDAYRAGALNVMKSNANTNYSSSPFSYLEFENGTKLSSVINPLSRRFSLTYSTPGGGAVIQSMPFAYTVYGVRLQKEATYKGVSFQSLFWDETTKRFYVKAGNSSFYLNSSSAPILALPAALGVDFSNFVISRNEAEGWSADFKAKRALVANNLPYNLTLAEIVMTFNPAYQEMALTLVLPRSPNVFNAVYLFSYRKLSDGSFKFTYEKADANGGLIEDAMAPLLNHFENDRFSFDYFKNSAGDYFGQAKSVENAGFFFTGTLE